MRWSFVGLEVAVAYTRISSRRDGVGKSSSSSCSCSCSEKRSSPDITLQGKRRFDETLLPSLGATPMMQDRDEDEHEDDFFKPLYPVLVKPFVFFVPIFIRFLDIGRRI